MLIIELLIFTIIVIYNYFEFKKLPKLISNILQIAFCIFFIKCILDLRLSLLALNIVILFFGASVGNRLREQKYKIALKSFLIVGLFFFINRGFTRVYDAAGVISPIQEYKLNSILAHQYSLSSEDTKFFIITKKPDTNMKQFNKKIRSKYFYTLILYYDNDGRYIKSKVLDRSEYGAENIESDINEKMNKNGLRAGLDSVPNMMESAIFGDDEPYDVDDYYADSPGTHWVNGYDRSDGTHVNGYERSNPDGNPYNNLNR